MNSVLLNAEGHIDELKEVAYKFYITEGNEILRCIPYGTCDNCRFDKKNCHIERIAWLCSEYEDLRIRPALDENVKFFLRGFKFDNYLARGTDGELYLFTEKPYKDEEGNWHSEGGIIFNIKDFLNDKTLFYFDFILSDDTEPWQIQELL